MLKRLAITVGALAIAMGVLVPLIGEFQREINPLGPVDEGEEYYEFVTKEVLAEIPPELAEGIKLSKLTSYEADLAAALKAVSVRVVAPISVNGARSKFMVRARVPSPTGMSIRPSSMAE